MRFSIVLIAFLLGCTSIKVIEFTNPKADFKNFKSYTILSFKGANIDSQNLADFNQVIKGSIRNEMTRRDYQIDNTNPDLLLRYELISATTVENRNNVVSPYDFQNYSQPRSYTESILLIELVNTKTKKLVWQASADLKDYQKKSKKNPLEGAVTSIFNTYLYRAGESSPDELLKAK